MAAPSTPKPIDVGDGAVHSSPAVPPLSLSPSRSPSPRPRNPILGRRPSSPLLHPPRSSSPRSAKSSHKGASPRSASAGRLSARSASVASTSNEPPPTPRKKKESRQLRGEIKGVVTSLRKSAWLLCDVKAVAALRSPHPSPQPLLHIIPALMPSCVVLSAHCASIHLCAVDTVHRRIDQARCIVQGTMQMLQLVSDDAAKRLKQNPKLCKRATGGPDETHAPIVMGQLQVWRSRAHLFLISRPPLAFSSPPLLLLAASPILVAIL